MPINPLCSCAILIFDLEADPSETRDVSEDPEYASTVSYMKVLLRAEREKMGLTDEIEQQIFNSGNVSQTRKQMDALLAMVDANTAKSQTASCTIHAQKSV